MNVIIGLCHSLNGKVGTYQESLVLELQAFVDVPSTSSGFLCQLPNVEVLAREEGWFKHNVRGGHKIKTLQPTIREAVVALVRVLDSGL